MALYLKPEQEAAIHAHGAQDYPHECCGFLIGHAAEENVIIHRTEAAANTRQDALRNRFEIDPGALVKTDRAARAEGLSVVGFYHSHPDAPARPSHYDREHAWPGYCYVIMSVQNGQAKEMNNWLLRDDRSGFDSDPIVIQENT